MRSRCLASVAIVALVLFGFVSDAFGRQIYEFFSKEIPTWDQSWMSFGGGHSYAEPEDDDVAIAVPGDESGLAGGTTVDSSGYGSEVDKRVKAPLDPLVFDSALVAKRRQWVLRKYDWEIKNMDSLDEARGLSRLMSIVSFVTVHVIILIAIVMAALEFRSRPSVHVPKGRSDEGALSKGKSERVQLSAETDSSHMKKEHREQSMAHERSSLKAGLVGLEMSSASKGMIMLGIGFAFYVLYLRYIVPIVMVPAN